jgi:hypothetical protein
VDAGNRNPAGGLTADDLDALAGQIWDEETAPPPTPKAGLAKKPRPQATKGGQFVLPFPGMRDDANRSEFINNHRRVVLDLIEAEHGQEAALDSVKPLGTGFAAAYDSSIEKLDTFTDDMEDADWVGDLPSEVVDG